MSAAQKTRKARALGQDIMRGEAPYTTGSDSYRALSRENPGPPSADGEGGGTSVFDPVLCEIVYRWFCPPEGQVLDPFAGGSVRGIVAGQLGRRYLGIDLRPEQVAANEQQATRIWQTTPKAKKRPRPVWTVGDARALATLAPSLEADLVFSCPPYADLEVYSDDPRDLSRLPYPEFRRAYAEIIRLALERLKPNRFAAFVVGDVRDKKTGLFRSFPAHTAEAFAVAGAQLYNQAILVTAAGSLPIRAGKQFEAMRKLGTTHQQLLVFLKGDARKAASAVGKVEFGAGFEELIAAAAKASAA